MSLTRRLNSTMSLARSKEPSTQLDPLTVTVGDLAELLNSKRTTSVDLVELYLDQIARHNHDGMRLNAIISTAPKTEVIERARHLDSERLQKGSRGPMHGIPVIVKVKYPISRITAADRDLGLNMHPIAWHEDHLRIICLQRPYSCTRCKHD